jgi:hypothetical protein
MVAAMRAFLRNFAIAGTTALLVLVGIVLLPHDRYIRWQDMQVESYARLGWIYERIHFDPTPIDVAFIGTSRTMGGIDASAVGEAITEAIDSSGTSARVYHVTNFAIPQYGRNLHWLIVRELLENRKVGMLVLEIFENETRKSHPLFVYPAEVSDVLGAPMFVNLNYLHDVVRLPYRQLSLFIKTQWPQQFGLQSHFDPSHYDGPTVDNTRFVQVHGKPLSPIRNRRLDPAELEAYRQSRAREKNMHMLGERFDWLEYRYARYYVAQILALAERKGVPVKFLYLPAYGQPAYPYDTALYEGRGEIITINDILAKQENWGDFDHLNLYGAAELSARVGFLLARSVTALSQMPQNTLAPVCKARCFKSK